MSINVIIWNYIINLDYIVAIFINLFTTHPPPSLTRCHNMKRKNSWRVEVINSLYDTVKFEFNVSI